MITREEFELLCRADVREAIEANLGRDSVAVALDRRIEHASTVATQVKYLERARRKLPSFYAARCIMPSLAFGQSSSEECAARKHLAGGSVVDLTCGLGVDAWGLSQRFERVVAVERDEVLADIARENFRRLGIDNVEVVCDTAEHFAATCTERFDWCFVDPDRRGADGGKRVLLEDCSPDITQLLPTLLDKIAKKACIKLSPMFDVDEAHRIFGRCSVETVSLGDECKEVLVYIDPDREPSLTAAAVGKGEFSVPYGGAEEVVNEPFEPGRYRWLIVPDVALQKARLVRRCLAPAAFVAGENGFAFAAERPAEDVLGRVFAIGSIERYEPRRLRRELKGCRAEILLRDVPLTLGAVLKAAGLREGGDLRIAFTSIEGEIWVIRLK